jgi:hypothetical protein
MNCLDDLNDFYDFYGFYDLTNRRIDYLLLVSLIADLGIIQYEILEE